jgi:hypothetical protein
VAAVVLRLVIAADDIAARDERVLQLGVGGVNAGVENRDDDRSRPPSDVPRLREAGPAETPLARPERILRGGVEPVDDHLAFDGDHRARPRQRREGLLAPALGRSHDVEADLSERSLP